jgi:translocation and assembly module TamB
VLTPVADIALDAEFRDFHAAGMSFDSLSVEGTYRGAEAGAGRAVIVAFQDEDTDYRADVQFSVSLDRSEVRLADASFRFDTITWQTTQPGVISWGGGRIDVQNLELLSSAGGRVYVHGVVPVEGSGDFDVRVQDLNLAQVATILQTEEEFAGVLNLDLRVQGTQANPVIGGTGSLADGVIDGRAVPDIRAALQYANQRLEADAELTDDGRMLATADASLPIALALTGAMPRLLDGQIRVDVVADSLPVESFPAFTDQVEDVSGRVTGAIYVRGTFDDPLLDGVVRLDLGTLRVVPLGVRFDDVAGTITLAGDVATVDSVVAYSGGPLRIDGQISVASLTDPVFDLTIDADNSRVINTDDAELYLDADIRVEGPLSALRVTGDIHTRSGVIYIPELAELGSGNLVNLDDPGTFRRMGGAFEDERALHVDTTSPFANTVVEVGVVIERDVWLRSTEANVEIYTPPEVGPLRIRMNGAGGDLRLEGSINTDRGDYEFMSRRFRMTRGAITFVGETPINPILQVAAEHEVRIPGREAFQIRVLLGGTVDDLEINLESTSQPPISQTDLLSYLAFGRDASSLLNQQGSALTGDGGAGDLVGNVAAIATQQLTAVALEAAVSEVERDVARELGLDVFRITPANVPIEALTGEFIDILRATEVEAGRYIQPRLFVGAQARAGRPGLRLEYRSPRGYEWEAAWQPRFMPTEPTLTDMEPERTNVLGAFLFRQWRF